MKEIKILHNVIITGNVLELKRFLKFELNKGQLEYNFSRANEPGPYIHLLQWEYLRYFHPTKNHQLTALIALQLFTGGMDDYTHSLWDGPPLIVSKPHFIYIKNLRSLTLFHIRHRLGFITRTYPNLKFQFVNHWPFDLIGYFNERWVKNWWYQNYPDDNVYNPYKPDDLYEVLDYDIPEFEALQFNIR